MSSFIPKIFSSTTSKQLITKTHTVHKQLYQIPPQHLYNIILDVNSYSDFLPFCKSSQILRTSNCGTMFDASLQIGFGGVGGLSGGGNMFEEEYVSRVTNQIIRTIQKDNNIENEKKCDDRHQEEQSNYDLEWIVTTKSIKSTLFQSLNSSWKLTQININNSNDTTVPQHHDVPELVVEQEQEDKQNDGDVVRGTNIIGTNVEFQVEISVSNPLITAALDGSLESVAKQQVAAFEKRCLEVPFNNE